MSDKGPQGVCGPPGPFGIEKEKTPALHRLLYFYIPPADCDVCPFNAPRDPDYMNWCGLGIYTVDEKCERHIWQWRAQGELLQLLSKGDRNGET